MSFFIHKEGGKKGVKAGGFKNKNGTEATVKSLGILENEILPLADLGLNTLTEVQVFWCPMDRDTMVNVIKGRDWMSTSPGSGSNHDADGEKNESKKKKLKFLLESARPPDSILGLPQWCWCHMGLILSASCSKKKDKEFTSSPSLYIIVDLYQTGVRVDHLIVTPSAMQARLKELVLDHCNQDEVFSAGINEQMDLPLSSLLDSIKSCREWIYNPYSFNCQHFTSILFQRFTNKDLSKCLRHRWTSNRSVKGDNPTRVQQVRDLSWAMRNESCLKELHVTDLDELLFSYSSKLFGRSNKLAAGAGSIGFVAGAAVVDAEAAAIVTGVASAGTGIGVPIMAFGASVAAVGLLYDKIPAWCPLPRATIWFRYSTDHRKWFWSPYRLGEVETASRWIPVDTLTVPAGRYEGKTIEKTSAAIAQHLARYNPFPLAEIHFECPICFEVWSNAEYVIGGSCGHQVCADCHARRIADNSNCPFCRQAF